MIETHNFFVCSARQTNASKFYFQFIYFFSCHIKSISSGYLAVKPFRKLFFPSITSGEGRWQYRIKWRKYSCTDNERSMASCLSPRNSAGLSLNKTAWLWFLMRRVYHKDIDKSRPKCYATPMPSMTDRKIVHMIDSLNNVVNFCDGTTKGEYTVFWKRVTCKRCLHHRSRSSGSRG